MTVEELIKALQNYVNDTSDLPIQLSIALPEGGVISSKIDRLWAVVETNNIDESGQGAYMEIRDWYA